MLKNLLNSKAAAAIEFAIVAPVFFILLLGIIEFGLTMYIDGVMNYSIKEVARKGSVKGYKDIEEVRAIMATHLGNFGNDDQKLKISAYAFDDVVVKRRIDFVSNGVPSFVNVYRANDTITEFAQDPEKMFIVPGLYNNRLSCTSGQSCQSSAMMLYAAKLEWGGFSNLLKPFIQDNLYAITVTRNENF